MWYSAALTGYSRGTLQHSWAAYRTEVHGSVGQTGVWFVWDGTVEYSAVPSGTHRALDGASG